MNIKRVFFIFVLSLVALAQASAVPAGLARLRTMAFGDQMYYYYEVLNKETIYGISQKLGVTQEEIIKYNPSAQAGVTKKQLLFFPMTDYLDENQPNAPGQITIPAGSEPMIHTIKEGETVCSIAKQFNTSVEGLVSANVGLSPDKYTAGEQIKVIPNSAMPFTYRKSGTRFFRHKVDKDQTLETIAAQYGTTVTDIIHANPGLKKAHKGNEITVPKPYTEQVTGDMRTVPLNELERYYAPRLEQIFAQAVPVDTVGEINIGIVLPFQLQKEDPPKQAFLYTDFYKGFMIALDSIQKTSNRPVNVKVYDTEHNLNVTDSLLALPEMKELDLIISPSEPKQMERIHNFGKANNIKVFNCFDTKSDSYTTNPFVYQVNIPTKDLLKNLMQWFDSHYAGCSVIFLEDPECEVKEMFTEIKAHILEKNYPNTTLSVGKELVYKTLSNHMNPGTSYVIIPTSSDKAVFKKAEKALKRAKSERFDCEFSLLVYPDYVLYLKDIQPAMQDLDTYMFSRFFNAKGYRTRDFEAAYSKMFGGNTLLSYPNMGLLGFDTAMYVIGTMNEGKELGDPSLPTYKGIQTGFRFERDNNWSGYVNQAIDIVHFTTDHTIITEVK